MQANVNKEKQPPPRGLKQVKVDNWGTFFLQRLQQLYQDEELFDLTIRFPISDITVQAHRLVVTTCTDYFNELERHLKEKDKDYDGVIIMPPDMPYECVKSIISFMYTGQLEYWTSEQNALYRTAQKMKMTVLTKLLDAQFNTSSLQSMRPTKMTTPAPSKSPTLSAIPTTPVTSTEGTSSNSLSTLTSQPLSGKKLPIWKRKLDTSPSTPSRNYECKSYSQKSADTTPGPSRFDLPEAEEFALGVFSSFDDITYNTKPIVQAPSNFKKQSPARRSNSLERSLRNDSTEDEEDDPRVHDRSSKDTSDDDWSISKSLDRSEENQPSKKVRFDLEEKENLEKSSACQSNTDDSITSHAKIIREVLKKYPHLVKNNKNIRLKIMQKEAKSSEASAPSKTKVSYVVLKSDHLMSNNSDDNEAKYNGSIDGGEVGPWKCNKCDLEEEYTNYYMYRRHMQDVHDEKFDPRVCEHCGYKATKRNILMYHLYTKHNVPPPKSMNFPKCQSCCYVALSETLLVRHQINHNHRPPSWHQSTNLEDFRCSQCSQVFKDITELTTHEINSGHGINAEGREKGYRCPHCGKTFVRLTNLQVHIDCSHKDLRTSTDTGSNTASINLEPSSEAEALSHVASGIATSLSVGEGVQPESPEVTTHSEYVIPQMQITDLSQATTYNADEFQGQQMIMLINHENYQEGGSEEHHQQPQQLDISGNEQIVMQGTEDGMIVYIHGNEETNRNNYNDYRPIEEAQETEEIVEEVVEEVEEAVMEEENEDEEAQTIEHELIEKGNTEKMEDVIQYVEEQTEIVEYDEEQSNDERNRMEEEREGVVIQSETGDEAGTVDNECTEKQTTQQSRDFVTEWDEYSRDAIE